MIFILSVLAAIIPTVFYIIVIYWVDRYEKEPWWLLAATFFWGAIPSIIAAFILNTLFTLPVYYVAGAGAGDAFGPIVVAPLVEETLKGLALLGILLLWRHEIDSVLDGIIYGAMVGLGFGMVEDVFYYMNTYAEAGASGWIANITLRTFFSLNHSLFTAMTGMGIAMAQLARNRLVKVASPIGGWMLAVFLHFVHNFSATAAGAISGLFCLVLPINAWGGVLITAIIMFGALLQERRWLREYLQDEIDLGTLTAAQYKVAISSRQRFLHNTGALFSGGPGRYWRDNKFFNRCSELAYKKHHNSRFGDKKTTEMIPKLRAEVQALSAQVVIE